MKHSLDDDRKQKLLIFQKKLDMEFKNLTLLDIAFHHRSFSNEHTKFPQNNERLEFLGDSVLGVVVSSYLYECMPNHAEGDLAKTKSVVVSEETLSAIALELGIDEYLVLGRGEAMSGGRSKKAILADAMEAIFAAVYLDAGFDVAQKIILESIKPQIALVLENKHQRDYKSILQELAQKKYKIIPRYIIVKHSGPDHDKTFWISVEIANTTYGPCSGKSKKEAEQAAAEIAWKTLS